MLADCGFTIAKSVAAMHAKVHIPAFTMGKFQLSVLEVEYTTKIANVRMYVKECQTAVFHTSLHLTHTLCTKQNEEIPLIDRIVCVCCALNNVCDSVVSFD